MKKRVLFLYASQWSGHARAASAIQTAIHENYPQIETAGLDVISNAFPILGPFIAKTYLEIIKKTPLLWDYLYDNPEVEKATREIRDFFHLLNGLKLGKTTRFHHPDVIVCTHALPCGSLVLEKRKGKLKCPLIGVITDFGVHSYWIHKEVDLYLVPNEEVKREMQQREIRENKILVTGIPIHPDFETTLPKIQARKILNLSPQSPTVLVMGGTHGLGPIEETVRALSKLSKHIQVIAVAGKNNTILQSLKKQWSHQMVIRIFGYTHQISSLMDASDLLIGKAGGLVISEALAKGLPLVIFKPLPGQEERNTKYLMKHAAAMRVKDAQELESTVSHLLSNKIKLQNLKENAKSLGHPYSASQAAQAILSLIPPPLKLVRHDFGPEGVG